MSGARKECLFGPVVCRIVARIASYLFPKQCRPDLRRRRFTRHLGIHEPRPRVGEDEVLDALIRRVEDLLAELARDNAACARAARGG